MNKYLENLKLHASIDYTKSESGYTSHLQRKRNQSHFEYWNSTESYKHLIKMSYQGESASARIRAWRWRHRLSESKNGWNFSLSKCLNPNQIGLVLSFLIFLCVFLITQKQVCMGVGLKLETWNLESKWWSHQRFGPRTIKTRKLSQPNWRALPMIIQRGPKEMCGNFFLSGGFEP